MAPFAEWKDFCRALYGAAVASADPACVVPAHLPDPTPYASVKLIAFGKAAAAMARAVEDAWPDVPLEGVAICRYGYGVSCARVRVIESAHPVPDTAAVEAANVALAVARSAGPEDLVLVLVSGGGSSLMTLPADGLTLADKQRITQDLLKAGAPIEDINCIRRHVSAVKGGRLALAAAKAGRIVTLAISDVVGDMPEAIASGPTMADPTTMADAAAILARHSIAPPPVWSESAKPGDAVFGKSCFEIIASGPLALAAAGRYAEAQGYDVTVLGDSLTGEARTLAAEHAREVKARLAAGLPRPTLLLSGGELTVTVIGEGQGGPNQEYVLALMVAHPADAPVSAFAADTDGMDGTGGAAGAWFTPETRAKSPDPASWLERNDSFAYFRAAGTAFEVAPTRTNVNDLRAILLMPDPLARF